MRDAAARQVLPETHGIGVQVRRLRIRHVILPAVVPPQVMETPAKTNPRDLTRTCADAASKLRATIQRTKTPKGKARVSHITPPTDEQSGPLENQIPHPFRFVRGVVALEPRHGSLDMDDIWIESPHHRGADGNPIKHASLVVPWKPTQCNCVCSEKTRARMSVSAIGHETHYQRVILCLTFPFYIDVSSFVSLLFAVPRKHPHIFPHRLLLLPSRLCIFGFTLRLS